MSIDFSKFLGGNNAPTPRGSNIDYSKFLPSSQPTPAPKPTPQPQLQQPTQPKPMAGQVRTVQFPKQLGGGEYQTSGPGTLHLSPRSQSAIPGTYSIDSRERDHIFPVALGGTSSANNLQYLNSPKGRHHSPTRQMGKYEVEAQTIRDYQAGRIPLGQARHQVLTKNQQISGIIPKQGVRTQILPAIRDTVWNPIKEGVSETANFIKNIPSMGRTLGREAMKNPGQVFSPKDVWEGVKTVDKGLRIGTDLIKAIPQFTARTVASNVMDATGQSNKVYTPQNRFTKAIFSEEPLKSASAQVEDSQKWIYNYSKNKGLDERTAVANSLTFAPLFVGGMMALDLLPIGGPGKASVQVALQNIAKSKAPNIINRNLKVLLKDAFKEELDTLTKSLINVSNPDDVAKVLEPAIQARAMKAVDNAAQGVSKVDEPLIQEARKYKSAEEFIKAQFNKKPEYGMSHRPSWEDMPPAYNLLEGETLPRDVYVNPDFSISSGRIRSGDKSANESWNALQKIKDKPEAEITVYRAGQSDKLNVGDWITFSKNYAKDSLEGDIEKVRSYKVKAKDVIFAGDDINEFGYYPKSQLTDIWKKANKAETPKVPVYKGEKDLTTKILKDLEGKSTVSKQYILDATNRGELKQVERDLIRDLLQREGNTVNVPDFAKKVKAELLPLKIKKNYNANYPKSVSDSGVPIMSRTKFESISLPSEIRGKVKNYDEHLYESPIKTSAGSTHFPNEGIDNYFGHTRIEDMADNKTRRVIEVQSDLYQKGNLEREGSRAKGYNPAETFDEPKIRQQLKSQGKTKQQIDEFIKEEKQNIDFHSNRDKELSKLQQYNDPTAHFRMVREEVKKAADDGKTKLQFPTGETAMKIEGLGQGDNHWAYTVRGGKYGPEDFYLNDAILEGDKSVIGMEARRVVAADAWTSLDGENWIITEVLGDGKFKAVPKETWDIYKSKGYPFDSSQETFDISGKVDTSNPIYKFYEKDVGKYLTNKYGAKQVTDDKGVKWWEVDINKSVAGKPVEAFGIAAGLQQDEEEGIKFNPALAALGVLGMRASKNIGKKSLPEARISQKAAKSSVPASPQGLSQSSARIGLTAKQDIPLNKSTLGSSKQGISAKQGVSLQAAKLGDSSVSLPKSYQTPKQKSRALENLKKAKTAISEYVQDTQERVKQLVERPGIKLDDISNPYQKETLYHGIVGTKISNAREEAINIINDIRKSDLSRKEISDYLKFRHAPERNAALGDRAAGVSTQEAIDGMAQLKNSPNAKKIEEIANRVQKLNNETLEMLKDSGVISDELFDRLRTKYKNHIPLNRIMEETDDLAGALSGKGFDVRSTGIKRAKGSEREVDDILGNVLYNYEQAVLRSEKNIVDQATLYFARNNKDVLGDLLTVRKPKIVGTDFNGMPIMEKTNDPKILQLFEKGKPVWVEIKDPQLAIAFRGLGREKLGGFLNTVGLYTRFYAGLATRFNIDFAAPNKVRDLQEVAVYMASEQGFKSAAGVVKKDVGSIKDVIDALSGKKTEGTRLYNEMRAMGGTTGGMGLSTRAKVSLDIDKLEKIANSKTRRIGKNLIEYVDNWNTIFEDSTRLSVYKQALKDGLSKDRAAFLAKEASINFNRMGKGGPVINALYMFSNASIRGSVKMIRSMKNPKVLGATALTVGTAVAVTGEWNDSIDPDWRDKVTKWDKLNALNVVLPWADKWGAGDGDFNYISIPVSWGLKPIKVAADYAYDATKNKGFDTKKFLDDSTSAILDSYNPVGGTDFTSAITPTILDLPVEIARNKKWSGSMIRPDYGQPKDIQYFSSLGDTKTGQVAISISELLQSKANIAISPADIKYGYEALIGGAGRFVNKTANLVGGVATKQPPPLDEYPLLSRFYRQRTKEEVEANIMRDMKESSTEEDEMRETFMKKKELKPKYDEIRSYVDSDPAKAQELVNQLTDEEYEVYKSIRTAERTKNTQRMRDLIKGNNPAVVGFIRGLDKEEQQRLINLTTDEEYAVYENLKIEWEKRNR